MSDDRVVGDDWPLDLVVQNPPASDGSAGAPINLAGYTIGADVYFDFDATPHPLSGSNGSIAVVDAANGRIHVEIKGALTALAPSVGIYGSGVAAARTSLTRLSYYWIDTSGDRKTFPPHFFTPWSR